MLLFIIGLVDVLFNDAHLMGGTPLMLLVLIEVLIECITCGICMKPSNIRRDKMPAQIYGMTKSEDFVVALEYTGQDCKVHHLDEKGGVDLIADAVVLAITPTTVITLCRGSELPLVFDRNTLQHIDVNEDGDVYATGDYELRGIPNVTIQ